MRRKNRSALKLGAGFVLFVMVMSVLSGAVSASDLDTNSADSAINGSSILQSGKFNEPDYFKALPSTKTDNSVSILSYGYGSVDLKNQTKKVHVAISNSSDDLGKFTMGGYYNGLWKLLLYGYPYSHTAYLTVRVENATASVNYTNAWMGQYVVEHVHGTGEDAVAMKWRLPDDIVIEQKIRLVQDYARIEIDATNEGSSTKKIGMRYYYDTKVARSDNAPIYIPGEGVKTTQDEYVNPTFTYWKGYDDPTEPTVVSKAKISGADATTPDKLQIGQYGSALAWENDISRGSTFSDSVVITYWNPTDVAPGQSKQVVTYYGIGAPVARGPFNISEIMVDRVDGNYCPGENVTIKVDVMSIGKTHEGSVKIEVLDDGNVLYSSLPKSTGIVPADGTITIRFNYSVGVDACNKRVNIKASLLNSSTLSLIDEMSRSALIFVDQSCPECAIKPDLAVNKITWLPDSICDGDQVAVNATIVNNGTDKATDFYVRFEIDGEYIGRKLIPDLPAGSNTTITQNWLACAGSHNVTVYVDDYDAIEESDETNNKMSKDLPFIQFPDLTVTNISLTPTDIVGGDTVTFTATIANVGAGSTTSEFYVRFEVDGKQIGKTKVADGLDSGNSTDVTQTWTATWADTINVSVDEYNAVVELDETNNWMPKALPGLPFPDLTVTGLTWDPKENVSAGDPVTFTATIENIGGTFYTTMGSPLKIAFSVNGEEVGCRNIVGGIRAGQPLTTTFTWTAQSGTNPNVCVNVDSTNIIPESNDDNNELCETLSLTIKSPDLTITQLTFDPTGSIHVGDTVKFTAEVANIGAGDYNGDFDIGFFVEDVFAGVTHVANGVPAGGSIFSTFNWTASSCSNPEIKAKADFFDDVRESDKANNEITETLSASVPYADLEITDINWSPGEDITDRDPVTFTVTVKNNGPGDVITDFNVYFDIDGYFSRTNVISDGLAADESRTTSFTWKATPGDGHKATAKADPDNVVPESDKTNNEKIQPLPFSVSLVEIFEVRVEPAEITTGIGGQTSCKIKINNYGSASSNFDITVAGPDQSWYILSESSLFLSAGEEGLIDLAMSVPEECENNGTFMFRVSVTSRETGIPKEGSATLIVAPTPVIHDLLPRDRASLGSDDITFSWNTYINTTTTIYLKAEDEVEYTPYTGAAGQIHTVVVSNLARNRNYTYYARSSSSCGSSNSTVRTFYIGNGISFTRDVYEFPVEKDYNQRVTIRVQNTDSEYHELLVEVSITYDELVLGFVGEGSQDNIIPLNPGESKDVTLAIQCADAQKEDYELIANLTSTRGDETLTDTARIKIHVHVPCIDYEIKEIGVNEITLMKTFRLTNRCDPIADLSISVADNLKENAYIEPVIYHYRLREGASVEFNVVPILSSSDFQPASPIPPVEGDITVNAAGIEAAEQVRFTVPEGKQPYKATVSSPGIINIGRVITHHCNNKPNTETPFDVHSGAKGKVIDDPLIMKFSAPGWDVKPHDLYISINGYEVGSLINTIPEGYYKFEVDPSFLIYPERGVAKNYIELHSVHQNGGHYLVSSDVEVRLNLENYETWVIASSQEEANKIAEANLPPGFYESPDSITIGEVDIAPEAGGYVALGATSAYDEVYLGKETTIRVTAEPHLDVDATFTNGDRAVHLAEVSEGVYEGRWTPRNPGDANGKCNITIRAKGSGVKGEKTWTVKIIESAKLKVKILEPTDGSKLKVDYAHVIRAEVTKLDDAGQECGPAHSAYVTAVFTNGYYPVSLDDLGGGIYSGIWNPKTPSDLCTITVTAYAPDLKPGSDSVTVEVKPRLELKIEIPVTEIDPYWDYSWLSRRPSYYKKRYEPNEHFDPNKQCVIPINVTPSASAVLWVKITDPKGNIVFDGRKIREKDQTWGIGYLDVKDFDAGNCKIEIKAQSKPLRPQEWDVEESRRITIERNFYYITVKDASEDVLKSAKPTFSVYMTREDEFGFRTWHGLTKGAPISVLIGGVSMLVGPYAAGIIGVSATTVSRVGFYVGAIWSTYSAYSPVAPVGEGYKDVSYVYDWYEQLWLWQGTHYRQDVFWPVVAKKMIPHKSVGRENVGTKELWGTVEILGGGQIDRLKNNFYAASLSPASYDSRFGPSWAPAYNAGVYLTAAGGRHNRTKFPILIVEPEPQVIWKGIEDAEHKLNKMDGKRSGRYSILLAEALENISFAALTDKPTFKSDETINITAIILQGDTPLEGTSVYAEIQRPEGVIDNLPLFDDGLHNDFEANDGFYCNSYTGNGVGVYKVTIFASGTSLEGKPFDLSTVLPVTRTAVTAEFNDVCSDRGIDTNGDGLFDYLVVDVGVNVTSAGDYGLLAELTDAQAACIARAQNYSRLDVGEQTVEFSFDGVRICRGSADGPYNLILTLYDLSTGYVLDYVYDEAYTTSAYSSSDFQAPPGELTAILSDRGTDTDGDGFYNYLTVDVGVNVTTSGNYTIEGFLYDTNGDFVMWADNRVPLNSGDQIIRLDFNGQAICGHGVNGPYNLTGVILYNEAGNPIDYQATLYTTSAYSYTDFQPLPARFNDIYSDQGKDTDSDGKYNYLTVKAGVTVTAPGNYAVEGQLYDADGDYIAWTNNKLHLNSGDHLVELDFDGVAIYQHGIDGAYNLTDLYLSNTDTNEVVDVAFDAYTTSAYSYADFETPSVQFNDNFADSGTDVDDDGWYDYLTIEVGVSVTDAGNYSLEGRLEDSDGNYMAYAYNYTDLDAGSQTVQLNIDGQDIRKHGVNGQYYLKSLRMYGENGMSILDYRSDAYTTSAYNYTQFGGYPVDLSLLSSDITFDPEIPTEGETVIITATISNTGTDDVVSVVVQFFDGNPEAGGTQIEADQTIASIAHESTDTAQVTWTAIPGTHDIFVRVDPYNSIPETSENNNQAFRRITVSGVVPDYDVELTVEGANATTTSPAENATYTLTVKNTGTKTDSYILSVDNPDGAAIAHLNAYSINNLAADTAQNIVLNVTDETEGNFRVNVTVISDYDPVNATDSVTTTTVVETAICGDVTGDSKVTMGDARRIEMWLSYPEEYPINNLWAADVTGDGEVTGDDARRIIMWLSDPEQYPLACSTP